MTFDRANSAPQKATVSRTAKEEYVVNPPTFGAKTVRNQPPPSAQACSVMVFNNVHDNDVLKPVDVDVVSINHAILTK